MPDDNYSNQVSDLPLWADEDAHEILLKICNENKIPVENQTNDPDVLLWSKLHNEQS